MATQMNTPPLAGLSGIARRLVNDGLIPEGDARKAVEDAAKAKIPIASWLADNGVATNRQVAMALSAEFGMPLLDVNALDLGQLPMGIVKEELIARHKALPLFKRGNRLFVGIADPTNLRALDEIKFQSNHLIEPILLEAGVIERAIELAQQASNQTITDIGDAEGLDSLETGAIDDEGEQTGVDATGGDDAPVVKFVNKVLVDAIKRGASDIHFEPYETAYRVRYTWTACCARSPHPRSSSARASPRA